MSYKTFVWVFILSVISAFIFFVTYFQGVFSLVQYTTEDPHPDPFSVFEKLFSPAVIISLIAMMLTGLAYRILGIVSVAKNKIITGGEKALWIIGFLLLGFVTAIVFLALAKSRQLVDK